MSTSDKNHTNVLHVHQIGIINVLHADRHYYVTRSA